MNTRRSNTQSVPKLRVAFDTNVLFTDVAHHLLRRDVRQLVEGHSSHRDLKIEWYLSDVVTREREYQMSRKAKHLYRNVEKLESLLGHRLTTLEIVSDRVRAVIADQLQALNISLLGLAIDEVDWNDVMTRAVSRLPPFDPDVTEKGFRDLVIAETFVQLVSKSPKSSASCRLAFVSGDKLIRAYLEERTRDRGNVRILEDLNELESLINTLVSEVPEDKIKEWRKKAEEYFFVKDNESSWFYRENMRQKIMEGHGEELSKTPAPEYTRRQGTWYIGPPVFNRKERQRLYWTTEIEARSTLNRATPSESGSLGGLLGGGRSQAGLASALAIPVSEEAGTAKSIFEVDWSVSVSQQRESFSHPSLDAIRLVETEFDVAKTEWGQLAEILKRYSSDQ